MADLAFLNQVLQRARNVFDRHVRVDTVLVEQVDIVGLAADERRFGEIARPKSNVKDT
jgi:hypothetical protein